MHALIVVSHPLNTSLTHSVATAIAQGIAESGPQQQHTAEIADLTREGFNPVFAEPDIAAFLQTGVTPPDVIAEQADSIEPMRWCWSFRFTGGRCLR